MITGVSYDDVTATLTPGQRADLEAGKGCGFYLDDYLEDRRYAVCRRYPRHAPPWPPAPFADVHFAVVDAGGPAGHSVVMLADGTVLDPLHDETRYSLALYPKVWNVTAVVPIRARSASDTRPGGATQVGDHNGLCS